jgi:hypothetical protein
MKLSEESWVKLPLKLLRQQGMNKASAAVCCLIIDQCVQADKTLCAWVPISTAEIARAAGYAQKTAKRAVLELEELGLIEIRRERGCASSYRLTGCVELCPAAFKEQQQRPARPGKPAKALTEQERAELDDYLSVVNRFGGGGNDA